ncbi:GAF and ANTAR domain-containing protein [Nocardioides mesophilus]|uniref:GAF and ANTAR domain-containing protein n=1 Tax=Nocardioides mesophilus TaxID=433659 RepID=A0A7G9RA49_9ACTN|nr:GAF and ANTAR domain-containing protein [Nocardioides mesophilus]QNN52474.1 GAF and ANTAR domain-containing protein [Nocardioides mesophilus]
MSDERLIETARRLYDSLTPGDLDETLTRITAAAVEVLPDVQYASITIKHADGTLETAAPTNEMLLGLDAAQYQLREGPCYEAASDVAHVISPNLAADERFPHYGPVALASGIKAQAGLRLFDSPTSQGALNLYSRNVGAFDDFASLSALFTHQAGMALGYAREISNLQEAVRTRKTIGQAIGILMERYKLSDERAFAFLSRLSQHRNVKLRQVAQEMVAATEDQHLD